MKKTIALKQITRRGSNNQPDHILVDEKLLKSTFATSYFNFISDHKSIVFRYGGEQNEFTTEALEKIHFDVDLHKRQKKTSADELINSHKANKQKTTAAKSQPKFRRRINNPDMASCWLNGVFNLFYQLSITHQVSLISILS